MDSSFRKRRSTELLSLGRRWGILQGDDWTHAPSACSGSAPSAENGLLLSRGGRGNANGHHLSPMAKPAWFID